MKIIILIISLLLFIPVTINAEMHGNIEIGYNKTHELWEYSADLELGHKIWKLYPKINTGWYALIGNASLQFQTYKIGYGIKIGQHLEINWNHYCIHKIDNFDKIIFDYDDFIMQSSSKISVKYKF